MDRPDGTLADHLTDPRNRGRVDDFPYAGRSSLGGAPPYVAISLQIANGIIEDARFEAQGCGFTIACCSMLTELVKHQSVTITARISADKLAAYLPELPDYRRFCAVLATEALVQAAQTYLRQVR